MIVLALDTSSRAGSVAVVHDDVVRVELVGHPAFTHGQRLPLELQRALEEGGTTIEAVNLFAVIAGPGSFTGLRVGIATIQGLAMAMGRKVVAVSALEAIARAAAGATHGATGAWMDAQRGEVFAALYAADARSMLIEPVAAPPAAVLESWSTRMNLSGITFAGDGAIRYGDVITKHAGPAASIVDGPPLAAIAGRIAASAPSRATLPHAIVPLYVRKSDAELARARREQGAR